MTINMEGYVTELVASGWIAVANETPLVLPAPVIARYGNALPPHYLKFIQAFEVVYAPKAWFVTSAVFAGASPVAFAWNEWEAQSIEAAGDDARLAGNIVAFWNRHCPLIMSVKDSYAHFSLNLDSGAVVLGDEPEYEEVSVCAETMDDFLRLVVSGALERWL